MEHCQHCFTLHLTDDLDTWEYDDEPNLYCTDCIAEIDCYNAYVTEIENPNVIPI